MINQFRDEFYWMLRESKGYQPWLKGHPHRLFRHSWKEMMCHHCCDQARDELTRLLLDNTFLPHALMELCFKALVRSEARFISRYVPQRSHEERLTGHLVSEMDNALALIRELFRAESVRRYNEQKEIDFLYYDLSRGGRLEKRTGADLGFILAVDLPDYPKVIKSVVLQAKKLNGSAQLTTTQHDTLLKHGEAAAYLFYDMDPRTLACPIVLGADDYDVKKGYEESKKKATGSFTLSFDDVMDGTPLSLYLIEELMADKGMKHASFDNAMSYFTHEITHMNEQFQGVVGIVSLGRRIQTTIDQDAGLRVSI